MWAPPRLLPGVRGGRSAGAVPGVPPLGGCFKAEPVLPHGWQGSRGGPEPQDLPGCPWRGGPGPPRGCAGGRTRGLRQEPPPYTGSGAAHGSPGSPRAAPGSQGSKALGGAGQGTPLASRVRAGSVLHLPFWPLCDDTQPGFPPPFPRGGAQLRLFAQRRRGAGSIPPPAPIPPSSHPGKSTCCGNGGRRGFARRRPNPARGRFPPRRRRHRRAGPRRRRSCDTAAASAEGCALRRGPRRQLGKT